MYRLLNEVSKSEVIDKGDLQAAAHLILNAALRGLNTYRASIWCKSDDKKLLECRLLLEREEPIAITALPPQALSREYLAAIEHSALAIDDITVSRFPMLAFAEEYLHSQPIGARLDAPIRYLGNTQGVLCCEHQGEVRHWQMEDIWFASFLADLYGRAIGASLRHSYELQLKLSNEQLESKVRERTQWLEDALRNLTHTQAKLIESEKLASVGRMVSGLAHEINTPIGIAVTSASHCESEVKQVNLLYQQGELAEEDFTQFLSSLREGLDLVRHNLQRAAQLVQNFRQTGSIQTAAEEEEFALKDCLDIIFKSLQPLLQQHQLNYRLSGDPDPHLNSYPGALAQILTNLVTNSIHHGFESDEIGSINIDIAVHDRQVQLTYSDNGRGIPAEIQDRIFEPFFTTARKTGGSGLGLAIVHNLVTQKLKGSVHIESRPDAGTRFHISFPTDLSNAS